MTKIINTTPHVCRFQSADGEVYEVQPCGKLVNAKPVNEPVGEHASGAKLVRVKFEPSAESIAILNELERHYPGAVIVGSIIAAQAFPGRVLGMIPAAGFERVPTEEKRMRDDLFTTF